MRKRRQKFNKLIVHHYLIVAINPSHIKSRASATDARKGAAKRILVLVRRKYNLLNTQRKPIKDLTRALLKARPANKGVANFKAQCT
jgi:hypothetical protein